MTARLAAHTLATALQDATVQLRAAGVSSPALDARLLLAHALDATVEQVIMHPDRELSLQAKARLDELAARRVARQPMAQLLGRREFWSRDFAVTADTLAPRPESEEIIAVVLDAVADRKMRLRILDLGCGTGCLLLTLLAELPNAGGLGIDASAKALAVARRNAVALVVMDRARLMLGDWGTAVTGTFDVVVCNPPYIATGEIATLEPEVSKHEPRLALDGGADGLDAYRSLAPDIARLLSPAGLAAVEVGAGQADDVARIFTAAGLSVTARRHDLAGHERCLVLHR
jgi:release factor glutamine methyltransferase